MKAPQQQTPGKPGNALLPWLIALAGMAVLGLLLPINPVPADDTAMRYAPMARAFAAGNWAYAFHPYSGVLLSFLSGSFYCIPGISAFRACQLAALLLWGLSTIPLYGIAWQVWRRQEVAVLCAILYLFFSHLHRFVYDGLRDNGRSLGFFLVLWALLIFWENRESWKAAILLACGAAVLMMIRGDCVIFGVLGGLIFIVLDVRAHRWRCQRSAVLLILGLLLLAPQLYLNWQWTGYPVPNARYAIFCQEWGLPPLGGQK